MNALKLSMTLIKGVGEPTDRVYSIIALIFLLAVPLCFMYVLEKNKHDLEKSKSEQQFGNLFQGYRFVNNIGNEVRKIEFFHLMFFVRRYLFTVLTVYSFQQPGMQTVFQMSTSLGTIVFMLKTHIFD